MLSTKLEITFFNKTDSTYYLDLKLNLFVDVVNKLPVINAEPSYGVEKWVKTYLNLRTKMNKEKGKKDRPYAISVSRISIFCLC